MASFMKSSWKSEWNQELVSCFLGAPKNGRTETRLMGLRILKWMIRLGYSLKNEVF